MWCGDGCVVMFFSMVGVGFGRWVVMDGGMEIGLSGEVLVGELLIMDINVGIVVGVMFLMMVKVGSMRMVVGLEYEVVWCGVGMLEVEIMRCWKMVICVLVSLFINWWKLLGMYIIVGSFGMWDGLYDVFFFICNIVYLVWFVCCN